jgi:hypothetical protein
VAVEEGLGLERSTGSAALRPEEEDASVQVKALAAANHAHGKEKVYGSIP